MMSRVFLAWIRFVISLFFVMFSGSNSISYYYWSPYIFAFNIYSINSLVCWKKFVLPYFTVGHPFFPWKIFFEPLTHICGCPLEYTSMGCLYFSVYWSQGCTVLCCFYGKSVFPLHNFQYWLYSILDNYGGEKHSSP